MQALIFDMDGTMIDNMMVHHRAWQQKLAEYGLELSLEEIKEKIHGINVEILERLFGDRFTAEERRRISWEKEAAYREIYRPDLQLVDGLPRLLEQLSLTKLKLAVASASPPENVDFVLDTLSLHHYFSTVLHSGSVNHGKPHPEIYLKTVAQLQVDPEDCLVFEDSPVGALSASRAGCAVVVVTTTHPEEDFKGIENIKRFVKDFRQIRITDWQKDGIN